MEKKAGVVSETMQYLKGFILLARSSMVRHSSTDEETNESTHDKLRQPGGWKTMPYIIGNESFERVSSFGLTANLTVYLVKKYHMPQVTAANFINIWSGTTNFAPLLGAFLADAYFGKYKVLAFACIVSVLGMVVMTLTAGIHSLQPPNCSPQAIQLGQCSSASGGQMGVLILALGLLTIGAGGVRPCNLPFGMDQFDRTTEFGRKGTNSFFNWYYTTNTAAVMVAVTFIVYLQDSVSWVLGFAAPALLMLLATVLFFIGTNRYIHVPPEGSIFSGVAKVFVAALKKRSLRLPADQESTLYNPPFESRSNLVVKLPLTQQYSCLNKAAIGLEGELSSDGKLAKPWRLCTVQRIEEVKCLIRVIPIWVSGITCFVAIGQLWTFAVLQSLTMDRHLGPHFEIPPGSYGVFVLLAIVLFLPIYDCLLVPIFRKFTGLENGITLLQRMGIGIVISALSMVVAGIVEMKRRNSAVAHGGFMTPMSSLWLVPQLALVGISEAFNAVGQIEFFTQQFPEQLRSMATSLFFCSQAGAGYLSSVVVTVVHDNTGRHGRPNWLDNNINNGRLDYFYYLLAGMGGLNLIYFLVCAHFYHYKGAPDVMPREEQHKQMDDTPAESH